MTEDKFGHNKLIAEIKHATLWGDQASKEGSVFTRAVR